MSHNLKATPSFLIELMNTSRNLDDNQAARLEGNLKLNSNLVLTAENVRRAQEHIEEPTKVERPIVETKPGGPKTKLTGPPSGMEVTRTEIGGLPSDMPSVPGAATVEEEPPAGLTVEEIPHYVQHFLINDPKVTIWAKEVFPIINILTEEIKRGRTIGPADVVKILRYYSKGNEPTGAREEEFATPFRSPEELEEERKEHASEHLEEIREQKRQEREQAARHEIPGAPSPATLEDIERVFGKGFGEPAEESFETEKLDERLKGLAAPPRRGGTRVLSSLQDVLTLNSMLAS